MELSLKMMKTFHTVFAGCGILLPLSLTAILSAYKAIFFSYNF